MGKHKEVSCKICFKTMRSNNLKSHMKVHIKFSPCEDQNENNEQICQDIVMEIEDEVFTQEGSATERNYGEHDSKGTTKRKLSDNGNCTTTQRKCYMINIDELRKMLEEETAEYDRKIDLCKAVETFLLKEK